MEAQLFSVCAEYVEVFGVGATKRPSAKILFAIQEKFCIFAVEYILIYVVTLVSNKSLKHELP